MCIKLVNYWGYTEMHGQQNIKMIRFWPPDDEHNSARNMLEAYNKLIIKQDYVH